MRSDIETAPRETIRETQSERLRETVEHAYENVPFYRQALDDAGVAPDDIDRVGDVSKLRRRRRRIFAWSTPMGSSLSTGTMLLDSRVLRDDREAKNRLLHRRRSGGLERGRRAVAGRGRRR